MNNPNPNEDFEKYMMSEDINEMIQYVDKIIYYKKKMVKLGRRSPDEPRVYINKLFVGLAGDNQQVNRSYRNTRFYQRQPKLCNIAKMASLILLKVYDEDDRYFVDEKDYERVLPSNIQTSKDCYEHGLGADNRMKEILENSKKVIKFQDDLLS